MKTVLADLHIWFGGLIGPEALIDITEGIIKDGYSREAVEMYFEYAREHRASVQIFLWNKRQDTASKLVEALGRHGIHYRLAILPEASMGTLIRAWTTSREAECHGTKYGEVVVKMCELKHILAHATKITDITADQRIKDIDWIDSGPPAFQTIWSARETIAYEEQMNKINSKRRKKSRKVP